MIVTTGMRMRISGLQIGAENFLILHRTRLVQQCNRVSQGCGEERGRSQFTPQSMSCDECRSLWLLRLNPVE